MKLKQLTNIGPVFGLSIQPMIAAPKAVYQTVTMPDGSLQEVFLKIVHDNEDPISAIYQRFRSVESRLYALPVGGMISLHKNQRPLVHNFSQRHPFTKFKTFSDRGSMILNVIRLS